MLYLGLDVHSKWMTIKGFDSDTGEIIELDKVSNSKESISKIFSSFDVDVYAAMESGTNSWSVYRLISPYVKELLVVDPATVWGKEIRRGAKTDKRDAMKLALKLYNNELVGLYIPDEKTQDQRCLVRAKVNATRQVTKITNEIGSLLRSWGIIVNCSLLTKKGRELLEESKKELPVHSKFVLEKWIELLEMAQKVEDDLDNEIKAEADKDEQCKLLMSIPGVGAFTALVVKAEIGDIRRFANASNLISYCGLSPSVSQSGDKLYYGRLNKFCNRYLKYALVLRGVSVMRISGENPLKKMFWRVAIKNHINDAKIAVARKLLRIMFSMLKNNCPWDPKRLENTEVVLNTA